LYLPRDIKARWGLKKQKDNKPHIDSYLKELDAEELIERKLNQGCRITVKGVTYCQQTLGFDPGARGKGSLRGCGSEQEG
jgi:hypothetical protein